MPSSLVASMRGGPSILARIPHVMCTLAPAPASAFANLGHLVPSQQRATAGSYRCFHRSGPLHLNRILFDPSEIDDAPSLDGEQATDATAPLASVTLPKDDYRTVHVAKILGLQNGDTLRAGSVRCPTEKDSELAGLLTDDATVTWLPEGKIKRAQPTKNGDPPGSLRISIPHPPRTSLWNGRNATQSETDTPPLGRILPMVAQLGIDQLILTNARKVPKDYFGSHIFRQPEVLRGLLVEGLGFAGDVKLPNVTVTKRLKIFVEDELDEMFPRDEVARVIAHPQRKDMDEIRRMGDVSFPNNGTTPKRILVAVGPEGGWEEPYELEMFTDRGFQQISLGTRVLRSDVAVVSLLALAHEVCATEPRSQ
ncbi:hypothetical protein ACHAXT_010602 [Thalassiosira profunda]